MKRISFFALSLAVVLSACNRISTADPAADTFTASFEELVPEDLTRSNVSDLGKFIWNSWDQVSVLATDGSFVNFALTGEAGTNSTTFSGVLPEGASMGEVAVYPAGSHSISGRTLTVNFPDTYTYPADTTDSCPVMVAKIASGNVAFKHVGGLMRIRYRNVPVKATHLVLTFPNQKVAGDFPVSLDDAEPVAAMTDGSSRVSIYFTSPTEPKNTFHFYLPLPTGTLTNMNLEFRDKDDQLISGTSFASTSQKVVTRAKLLRMPGLVLTVINAGIEENGTK